ncbi:MAG: rhodanese-like domain-containing protein [Flavobacteriaceae bacterium]|nr:rhodanese-like domain-containing protein [Flavobacteriaceae bacterium]
MDLNQLDWREKSSNDNNSIILDVRTSHEVEEGMITGSINIDIYEGHIFLEKIKKLDKTKSYYVYCKAGARSAQACAIMQQLGFEKTYNLLGGISNWNGSIS